MSRRELKDQFDQELLDFANELRKLNGKPPFKDKYEQEYSARRTEMEDLERGGSAFAFAAAVILFVLMGLIVFVAMRELFK